MERLTTNKEISEMNMVELAYNSCFAKDRNATYRDFESEIDARGFIRKIGLAFGIFENGCDELTDDEAFDEVMADNLQYGYDDKDGLIALLYRNLWAQANLYERLKRYEDLEEQGLLLKLPCKVGDTVYYTHPEHLDGKIEEYTVTGFCFDKQGCQIRTYNSKGDIIYFYLEFIGKTVFLTQAEAEKALKVIKG